MGMKNTRIAVTVGMVGLVMVLLLALAAGAYRVAGKPAANDYGNAGAAGSGRADKADEAMAAIRPDAIRADMRFLSDDLLEGRGTGTRGHELAAKYVAAQFEQIGLQPWGDAGTYFQRVPYRSARPDGEESTLTLVRGGKEERLEYRKDFITSGDPGRKDTSVEAPVLFTGHGVTAREQGYDDYARIDAKGKIVAVISGAPDFETSIKAHYSSAEVKQANAVAHGAVGALVLDDPRLEKLYGFDMQMRDLAFPQLRWVDGQGRPNDYFPELKGNAFLNMAATKEFFKGSGHTAEEVYAALKAGKTDSFALPMTARMSWRSWKAAILR